MFEVKKFTRVNGSCPFEDYMATLKRSRRRNPRSSKAHGEQDEETKDEALVFDTVDRLAKLGAYQLQQIEWAKKLNDVSELRRGRHRIFFFWHDVGKYYLLLNGYKKQGQKTPLPHKRLAERLRAEYLGEHRRG